MNTQPRSPESALHTLQVITAAMVLGVVIFAAVVAFLLVQQRPQQGNGDNETAVISALGAVAVVMLLAGVAASLVVPGVVARASATKTKWRPPSAGSGAEDDPPDDMALIKVYQAAHIVRMALLEGPTMLLCIAAFLEANWLYLGLALIPLIAMAAAFPTQERLRTWLETQRMNWQTM